MACALLDTCTYKTIFPKEMDVSNLIGHEFLLDVSMKITENTEAVNFVLITEYMYNLLIQYDLCRLGGRGVWQ